MADYSIDSPPVNRWEFNFDKKYLKSYDSEQCMTLSAWKDKYLRAYRGDLILQMDIEGFEYEVILATEDELLDQFRIAVIEFHELQRLFDPSSYSVLETCFQKLLKHFYVVHLHPNNYRRSFRYQEIEIPQTMEFTLYNKKRVREVRNATIISSSARIENNAPTIRALYLPDAGIPIKLNLVT